MRLSEMREFVSGPAAKAREWQVLDVTTATASHGRMFMQVKAKHKKGAIRYFTVLKNQHTAALQALVAGGFELP